MKRLFRLAIPRKYRLTTLFIAVSVFCIAIGCVAEWRRRALELHANCQRIASHGGFVILAEDAGEIDSVFSYRDQPFYRDKHAGEVTVRDWFRRRQIAVVEFGRTPLSVCDSVLRQHWHVTSLGLHAVSDTEALSIDWENYPQLESLWLFSHASKEQLTGISKCSKLRRLRIEDCGRGDGVVSAVVKCRSLEVLTMANCGLTDNDIKSLATLKSLDQLILYDNHELTDESLPVIATAFPRLSVLYLTDTSIDGSRLNEIASLRQLRLLNLRNTKIDDDALDLLSGLPTLECLDVSGCDVSQAAVDRFRATSDCLLIVESLR